MGDDKGYDGGHDGGDDLSGRLVVASPLMTDPNFARTVVLILAHAGNGAMGVVLNRPSEAPVSEHLPLWASRATGPPVVFVGGPVEPRAVIALEETDDPEEPTSVAGVGVATLSPDEPSDTPLRVFSGYAGWGAGQLDAELAEKAWVVADAVSADVFTPDPGRLWASALRRLGGRYRLLATYPPDVALN